MGFQVERNAGGDGKMDDTGEKTSLKKKVVEETVFLITHSILITFSF